MKVEFDEKLWVKPTNINDAVKMIQKIKNMFPIAGIIWQPQDVIEFCVDKEEKPTKEEAEEVISLMEDIKDCNYGLTWDILYDCINQIIEDKTPGLCPWCNGSGEGMHYGTTCTHCKGTGEEKRKEK